MAQLQARLTADVVITTKAFADVQAGITQVEANQAVMTQKIADLQAAIAAGSVPQEVTDAANALEATNNAAATLVAEVKADAVTPVLTPVPPASVMEGMVAPKTNF
jgi:hypothetical protein